MMKQRNIKRTKQDWTENVGTCRGKTGTKEGKQERRSKWQVDMFRNSDGNRPHKHTQTNKPTEHNDTEGTHEAKHIALLDNRKIQTGQARRTGPRQAAAAAAASCGSPGAPCLTGLCLPPLLAVVACTKAVFAMDAYHLQVAPCAPD